jgi:Holliday junction resolvase RusA-like endonuclease
MTIRVTLNLPIPPSVNRLWRVSGRRVHRSARYVAWQRSAGWELQVQKPAPFPADATIGLNIRAGMTSKRRDIDNLAKAICDLMQAHGVIDNDAAVKDLRLTWDDSIEPGRVRVEAWAIERAAA